MLETTCRLARWVTTKWSTHGHSTTADEYSWLIQNIRDSLPGSFFDIDERRVRSTAIAQNALLDVCVADNQSSIAVFIVPTQGNMDGYPSEVNLAYGHLSRLQNDCSTAEGQGYELSIRTVPGPAGSINEPSR